MNTKLFALLLLIPAAVFATDRLLSTPTAEGGGKEKKTSTKTQPAAPTQNPETPAAEPEATALPNAVDPIPVASATNTSPKTAAEAAKILAASILSDAYSKQYFQDSEQFIYRHEESLDPKLMTWLRKRVEEVMEDINPMVLSPEDAFSRCASGYYIVLVGDDGHPTDSGWMIANLGCRPHPIGKFKYDMQADVVTVDAGDQLGELPIKAYLQLLKASQS